MFSDVLRPTSALVEHIASLSDYCGIMVNLTLQVDNVKSGSKNPSSGSNLYCILNSRISLKLSYSDIADWWDSATKLYIKEFCKMFSQKHNQINKKNE